MPPPPDSEEGEKPNLQFAVVECALFTFHQLLKLVRKGGGGGQVRRGEGRGKVKISSYTCG